MPLSTGSRLGPYEILAPLGAGGMGEVYKARDTRLDRTVAVKVLPGHIAARDDLRARFEREARAVSSLNHPHICTLHDVGREGDIDYMVMEHLEGESLFDRLQRGPLPLEQALKYAQQIADAVDRAHRHGVIHRDLKPGNIMLTRDGAKILDFGLAKGAPKAPPDGATLTAAITTEGTILGTPQYMAPEQIEGREADARSDIFAFGCVLYEMVTGKRAFDGKTKASVIGAILAAEPPSMSSIQPVTPCALERLVARCLAKDPEDRYQSLRDTLLDLRSIGEAPPPPPKQKRPWLPWAVSASAAFSAAAMAILWLRTPATIETGPTEFTIESSIFTLIAPIAVSPDGRFVIFQGGPLNSRSLWLRALDSAQVRPLPGTDAGSAPFWSPDGQNFAFFADGKLKRVALSGGGPQVVCDASPDSGTWNREGTILFTQTDGLYLVDQSGGTPRRLTAPKSSGVRYVSPSFLPDGKRFLYLVRSTFEQSHGVYASSLDRPQESFQVTTSDSQAIYIPEWNGHPAYLLFRSGLALMAQPVDRSLRLQGSPIRLADDVATMTGRLGLAGFSAGGATVAYRGGGRVNRQMVRMGRNGQRLQEIGAPRTYESLRLSPDGQYAAFGATDGGGNLDVWVLEFRRGVETRLTTGPGGGYSPVWSPDGRQIAFCSSRDGRPRVYRMSSEGGADQPLAEGWQVRDWSRDGRHLLFVSQPAVTSNDLLALPLADSGPGKPIPISQTRFNEPTASFSPDGRWVAYQTDESGGFQIYVKPFPETTSGDRRRVQVSKDGGFRPRWRADGQELFYLSPNDEIMAAQVRILPDKVEVESPKALFRYSVGPFLNYSYDVLPDGKEFVVLETKPGTDAPLTIVTNWQARFQR